MALIKCKECDHEISKTAKRCPQCGAKNKRPSLIGIVGIFILSLIILGNIFGSADTPVQNQNRSPNHSDISFDHLPKQKLLEVPAWSCAEQHGYMTIEGEVKNISSSPIKYLKAIGDFRTEDGTFVKSDDALIEYSPLLPGQTSPFKVMSRHNPAISTCRISFKGMSGQKIPHEDLR